MDINTYIWILPAVFGVITAFLLLYLLWLAVAPGPRPRTVNTPPPAPPPQPAPAPRYVESDDTIIDNPAAATGAGSMVIESGLPGISTIDFPGTEFRIGRFRDESQNVLVALDEKSVSRSHALLRLNPGTGQYTIQDIGSRFGTFIVNAHGQPEQIQQGETRPVYNGTVVQFGSAVRVRLLIPTGGYSAAEDFDPGITRL